MPIKVLYDISVLGLGHVLPLVRTGIFRVVEHGAMGMVAASNCEVNYCASQSNYLQCNQYLAAHPELFSAEINVPNDPISRFYAYIEPSRVKVHKHPDHVLKNDLVRYVYHMGKKFTRPIARQDINAADIYHSPAYSIPSQVFENRHLKPFITIHDIIPLVYGDTHSTLTQMFMQTVLDSIKPETFVVCDSCHTKNDLCNYLPSLDPERVKVSYLAAGDNFYQCSDAQLVADIKKKCGVPEGCSYLLALSTLIPRKNFSRTVRCFVAMLKESHVRDLYLILVGERGLDYEDILFEIESAGEFRNRILLAGYLPDEDLAPLYSGATAFLYLSFYEGFGLPPLEAMQCGTAVITSNTSSLPEVVGDAAILVDPADEDAICNAMLSVYKDSSLRTALAEKSLQRAKKFSWELYNERVISAYQNAL